MHVKHHGKFMSSNQIVLHTECFPRVELSTQRPTNKRSSSFIFECKQVARTKVFRLVEEKSNQMVHARETCRQEDTHPFHVRMQFAKSKEMPVTTLELTVYGIV